MQIHINKNDQKYGPYSVEELRAYLTQGSLSVEDFAWYEGLPDWVQIHQIQGLAPPVNDPVQSGAVETQQASVQQQQAATAVQATATETVGSPDGQSGGGVSASAAMERLRKLQKGGAKSASPRKVAGGASAAQGAKGKSAKKKEEPRETGVVAARAAWKKHLPLVGVVVIVVAIIGGLVWWLISKGKEPLPSEKVSSKDTKDMAQKLSAAGFFFNVTSKGEINTIWISPKTKINPDTLGLLVRLKNLQKLVLRECNMDDMAVVKLGALVHLKQLDLRDNQNISDKSVVTLKKLVKLEKLGLDGTFITSRGHTELKTTLEGCTISWKPVNTAPPDPKGTEKK